MQQNIKKAIEILDYLVEAHIRNSNGIRDLIKDWNNDTKHLGTSIASVHEDVAKCLFTVKKLLEEKKTFKKKIKGREIEKITS